MYKTTIKLFLLSTIFSTQLSLNTFAMEDDQHKQIKKLYDSSQKKHAAENEEEVKAKVKKQKEETKNNVKKFLEEDNRPQNLTNVQMNKISNLDADAIVKWWDENMKTFHGSVQQSYSTSIAKLTEQYENDEITEEKFKEKLISLLK